MTNLAKKHVILLLAFCTALTCAAQVEVEGLLYGKYMTGAECLGPKDKTTFTTDNLKIADKVTIDGTVYNVIHIGQSAFDGCKNITGELKLPSTVTDVGMYAFRNCSGFTGDLDLSHFAARGLSDEAFKGCSGFNGRLILGDVLEAISRYAFTGCSGFTGELDLSHITVTIYNGAFKGCTSFTSLKLSDYTEQIFPSAFEGCTGLRGDIVIPRLLSETSILGDHAFAGCTGLDGTLTFTAPMGIGSYAFQNCSFTGTLDLSKINQIEEGAFQNCSGFTGDLVISSSIKKLYSRAFEGCSGFNGKLDLSQMSEDIKIGGHTDNTYLGDYLFKGCSGLKGDIIIPDFITHIGRNTFDGCSGFDGELKLSANLEYIEWIAFRNCSGLKGTLTFPASFKQFGDIDYGWYAIHAFNGCKGFTSIVFEGNEVNAIPDFVFANCTGLTGEIKLPTITESHSIDESAFSGCKNLTSVVLDDNITTIAESAFAGCESLEPIKLPASITEIGDKAFYGCSALGMDFIIPETMTKIGAECFSASGLTGVVIPKSDNLSIGKDAFANLPGESWIISLSDNPSASLGIDGVTPLYVHSQSVDTYKNTFTGNENIHPILTIDDIELTVNGTAKIVHKYQPELSEETERAILSLSTKHKGETIGWSAADAEDSDIVTMASGSSIIHFDTDALTITGLKEGKATVTANDGVNIANALVSVSPEPAEECDCCMPGDSDAQIHDRIFMIPDEDMDLTELLGELSASTWTCTNDNIVTVSEEGEAHASEYGEVYVRAKDEEGKTIAVIAISVCPTITVQHGAGILYTHHVPYNTRPTLVLSPGGGYKLAGVTHDAKSITDNLVDNDGKYVPTEPITKDSFINIATFERDSTNDPVTSAGSVWSDSDIRVYVAGHYVRIDGIEPGTQVTMTNLAGTILYKEKYRHSIYVGDAGIYLITVDGEAGTFKILVQ